MPRQIGMLAWSVVALVAVLVLGLVFSLSLYPRLNAGQDVVDGLRPAFAPQRVAGDTASVNMISEIVDVTDPIVNEQGGAAAEVPKLVAFVSTETGLTQAQVLQALQTNFPYLTHLLQSLPLSAVTAEFAGLLTFLSTVLAVSPAELQTLLRTEFPALTQVITALPPVTNGWEDVPGTAKLTRFDGEQVRSVPEVRDYFAADVVPAVAQNQANFERVDTYWPPVSGIPILLTVIGVFVFLFALFMFFRTSRGLVTRGGALMSSTVVLLLGVLVLGLVFGLGMFPRLNGGAELITATQPIFTQDRVAGDVAAVKMVSDITDVAAPITTADGAAPAEVGKLVGAVSAKTKLSAPAVVATLQKQFPHVANLLQALPLSSVTTELPKLTSFLSTTLNITPAQLQDALDASFPALAQVIAHLPAVTTGWNAVPGTQQLTRFDGTPVRTMPEVRDYLQQDVVPAIDTVQADYRTLATTSPALDVFPPLLTMVGLLVLIYGLVLIPLWGLDPGLRTRSQHTVRTRPA